WDFPKTRGSGCPRSTRKRRGTDGRRRDAIDPGRGDLGAGVCRLRGPLRDQTPEEGSGPGGLAGPGRRGRGVHDQQGQGRARPGPKAGVWQFTIGRRVVTVGGMTKGAGMIHPQMATTLTVLTTDAAVAPAVLQAALRRAADQSFNRITVDGDRSTNDTILVF